MKTEKVSLSEICLLQVLFAFAYVMGVGIIVGFVFGAYTFAVWALNLMIIELLAGTPLGIHAQVTSRTLALLLITSSLAPRAKYFKSQLIEYWMMIVNIESINNTTNRT
jgi:hypothetical protein